MRFEWLSIPAYGPFTDLRLEFPASATDLQVIYGPNEAGKSSLLRALTDLLFGIHGQTHENFIHDYGSLRIAAEIVKADGERLAFQRRKGIRNTLINLNEDALPDDVLTAFLGAVDAEYFRAMFGLNGEKLRTGAMELLRGRGNMGEALFSANFGGTPVKAVIEALEKEAKSIFDGRAVRTVSLRPTVRHYEQLLSDAKDKSLKSVEWEQAVNHSDTAQRAKKEIEKELQELEVRNDWLSRCLIALPMIGKIDLLEKGLIQLPALPQLPEGFTAEAHGALKTHQESLAEYESCDKRINDLQEKMDRCRLSPELLSHEAAIDGLHQNLGAHKQNKKNLAEKKIILAGLEAQAQTKMADLGLSGPFGVLESLRQTVPERLAAENAALQLQQARRSFKENADEIARLTTEKADLETQIALLPSLDDDRLSLAVSVGQNAVADAQSIADGKISSSIREVSWEVDSLHRALSGISANLDEAAALPVPQKATIQRFYDDFGALKNDKPQTEKYLHDAEKKLQSAQMGLEQLERCGSLPGVQDLEKAREIRDHGWRLVLADWKQWETMEEPIFDLPLDKAYPKAVKTADDIADRLRNEADAVAQAEEKRAQIRFESSNIADLKEKLVETKKRERELALAWRQEWQACGIVPGTPAEMLEWRETWVRFKECLKQLRLDQQRLVDCRERVGAVVVVLQKSLEISYEEEFNALLRLAQEKIKESQQTKGQMIQLKRQLEKAKATLSDLQKKQFGWEENVSTAETLWRQRRRDANLPDACDPGDGLKILDLRNILLKHYDAWKAKQAECDALDSLILDYKLQAIGIAEKIGIDGDIEEDIENRLWNSLQEAKAEKIRYDGLIKDVESERELKIKAGEQLSQAEKSLDQKIKEVGATDRERLTELLNNLERHNHLESRIQEARDMLTGPARGQSLDDFIARVRAEDPDRITAQQNDLQRKIEEKKSERDAALQTVHDAADRQKMLEQAGDEAAHLRQMAEIQRQKLCDDAERYLRLQLAVEFLRAQIERFRKENQGPLMNRSGRLFRRLTGGSFVGLAGDFNEQDEPVLVGIRAGTKSRVKIEGMSDGTRDQLYLALRLAALERHMENHEPMPLILDDLLITFDDERAKAILPVLADLAQRTQIMLFTHHRHIITLAEEMLQPGDFRLHELEVSKSKQTTPV